MTFELTRKDIYIILAQTFSQEEGQLYTESALSSETAITWQTPKHFPWERWLFPVYNLIGSIILEPG